MTVLLIVAQLLSASPMQLAMHSAAAIDPCCAATFEVRSHSTTAVAVVNVLRSTFSSVPRTVFATVKAAILYTRAAVGVVMRSFVGVMLGSRAFLRTSRRS